MIFKVTIRILSLILILTTLLGICLPAFAVEETTPQQTQSDETLQEPEATTAARLSPGYIKKDVPLYDQKKYPRIPFGTCSIATDGCGVTCAAMVIGYFTEFDIMPDYMGRNYDLQAMTNEQRMIKALHDFNIYVVERYYGKKEWKKVYQKLEEGYLVISLQGTGLFTTKEHFILLTGLTEDGKVLVNDPNGSNYKFSRELKKGFKNGFEENQIYRSGGHYYVLDFTGCFIPFGIKPSPYSHTTLSKL